MTDRHDDLVAALMAGVRHHAATIQAVDWEESTVYVLRRDGLEPVVAHWPQHLLDIAPDAVRIASHYQESESRGITVSMGRCREA